MKKSSMEVNGDEESKTKLSSTMNEMLIGMIIFGFLCELVGIWFVPNKLKYSIGLWIGIVLAIGMALHMAWEMSRAMNLSRKNATVKIQSSSMIRYGVVVIIYAIVAATKIGDPLAAFLGIMSLKFSAYLQPLTHKFCLLIRGNK